LLALKLLAGTQNKPLFALRVFRVNETEFQLLVYVVFSTATLVGDRLLERLLVEVGEDVRRVHEDGQSAGQRDDSVDVEQETVEEQRDIAPVINHLYTDDTQHQPGQQRVRCGSVL